MQETGLIVEDQGAVRTLRLNRPAVHNAFDATLIPALTAALQQAGADVLVRVVVVTGAGAAFSAGADLHWMRSMVSASETDNAADALALARLMRTLDELPKPTIARVNGAAFGGGVGLVACCDIAIGCTEARFGLTESRLGLLPAVISPYVIAAIGARQARRWFATAEIFDAGMAQSLGLLHQLVAADQARHCGATPDPPAALRRSAGRKQRQGTGAQHAALLRTRCHRRGQRRLDRPLAGFAGRPGRPGRLPRQAPAGVGERGKRMRLSWYRADPMPCTGQQQRRSTARSRP